MFKAISVKHRHILWTAGILSAQLALPQTSVAQTLETMLIEGRKINLVGDAISASQGVIGQHEIALRPLLRTGEVLEMVPGMVVTQHSGTGKANQYYLRGFNLDHGTDFATFVDGMPLNMRTHGHGQGYTDLNPLIPELVEKITYKKGAYYADVGDFSGAGSASIKTLNRLDKGLIEVTLGEDGYGRLVTMDSVKIDQGDLLYALEVNQYDGPWTDIDEDLKKTNLLLKYSQMVNEGLFDITLMGYDNSWNSADQIPTRAVSNGLIDELGSIDDTAGGESSRNSLSTSWRGDQFQVSAYATQYDLQLWSNFTYFLDDPINGDQFEQVDKRWIYGGQASYQFEGSFAGKPMTNRIGTELRYDQIDEVGLYRTTERQRTGTIRKDTADEFSAGIYWENQLKLTDKLRSIVGARYDYYDFDVTSDIGINNYGVNLEPNSGTADDDIISVKGSLIYTLDNAWEIYGSVGQGFHSNDARGTTITVDPLDGSSVSGVDPLVGSLGYELGLRGYWMEKLNTSIALWQLNLDSELLFVGDAGNTEASRKSERQGVEVTAYYNLTEALTLDVEYAWTDAEFTDDAPEGNHIPGAVEHVIQAGISAELPSGWFGSLRVRYFGERPLIEDASVKSDSSTVVNLRIARQLSNWTVKADLLNLLDSNDHDIDYFYESQLAGETQAVEDIHYHVIEPRTVRLSVGYSF
ncbi:TonB-dependent receptor [Oceanicoccus sp. KOV_DT_Chl]|uniref:TonB-dependent receptor n=1 Tax=Oceanicoccus sp. KOV_DT_Chl TaxID=1904639 RepID=UPI000C7E7C8A|nr:TonB-dependent receptor [Oceanicoccus sp. KOV_DT_Chl]